MVNVELCELVRGGQKRITRNDIHDMTRDGQLNRKQCLILGIDWPPVGKWRRELEREFVDFEIIAALKRMKND